MTLSAYLSIIPTYLYIIITIYIIIMCCWFLHHWPPLQHHGVAYISYYIIFMYTRCTTTAAADLHYYRGFFDEKKTPIQVQRKVAFGILYYNRLQLYIIILYNTVGVVKTSPVSAISDIAKTDFCNNERRARSTASCNRRDSWSRYRGILAITILLWLSLFLLQRRCAPRAHDDYSFLHHNIIYISYYCHFIYYRVVPGYYVWRTPNAHRIKYYRASTFLRYTKTHTHTYTKNESFFVRSVMYLKLSSCTRAVCFKRKYGDFNCRRCAVIIRLFKRLRTQ